ncbi:hypothetical protein DRP04_02195, partial [Archaeoglobales archaeon]
MKKARFVPYISTLLLLLSVAMCETLAIKLIDNDAADIQLDWSLDGSEIGSQTSVGSDGSWETEKLHISASAPKTSYTIDAYIIKDDGTKSDWKD